MAMKPLRSITYPALALWLAAVMVLPLRPAYSASTLQQPETAAEKQDERPAWSLDIRSVEVGGRATDRPMKDIGVQQTRFDTTQLHDNIAMSMADLLTQKSTIFIKSYGRATLSTASFRGTSASHTQVTWNGMKINSPMLGMVDFSMIPAYFIDDASLLHGTSSVNVTGGGLGGAVTLATKPLQTNGFGLQYIQGIGSFSTFDEFLRLTYGSDRWQVSTRAVYSSSPNDYKYTNYKKKVNMVYDDDRNLISFDYPVERNKCGDFHDLHLLQEVYYNTGRGDRLGLAAWIIRSDRGVPMLDVDYRDASEYENTQRERTLRSILSWDHLREQFKLSVKAGYTHTFMAYDYSRNLGNGSWQQMIRSRSRLDTFYGQADAEYYLHDKWSFTLNVAAYQHMVESADKSIISQEGDRAVVGYDKARVELTSFASVKWRPVKRLGFAVSLREDMYGNDFTPLIPAFFADWVLSERGNVVLKGSISRNYRYPTLNDQFFLPGGNPDLKPEHGFTYDGGVSFSTGRDGRWTLKGEATAFDSYIDNWIIWLPSFKGFWEARNVKNVHAYGVEVKAGGTVRLADDWLLELDGNWAWTPSINNGDPTSWGDQAIGKQMPYIPRYSAGVTGRLTWRTWALTYKWYYYSQRYTTSSNETLTRFDRLAPYFMNDLTLEKRFSLPWAELSLKGQINNLFNEEYVSVLSRPMPRMNFEFFIEIRPKFKRSNTR